MDGLEFLVKSIQLSVKRGWSSKAVTQGQALAVRRMRKRNVEAAERLNQIIEVDISAFVPKTRSIRG